MSPTVAQMWGEGMALDLRADLGSIDAPVTVVIAADPAVDAEHQFGPWRNQTAAIPDVELVVMNGRHFVMYDQPEEFHALMRSALAESRGPSIIRRQTQGSRAPDTSLPAPVTSRRRP